MKTNFFSKSVQVQCGRLGCLPYAWAIYRWCLGCSQNESLLTVFGGILLCYVALLKLKVAFSKDLGFVEALPDKSPAKKLSGFSSWSKVVWKYGQLKEKKKKKRMGSTVHMS